MNPVIVGMFLAVFVGVILGIAAAIIEDHKGKR